MKKTLTLFTALCLLMTATTAQVVDVVTTGLNGPYGVTLSGNSLYIAEYLGNKISKIDISQPNPTPVDVATSGIPNPSSMFLNGNDLYIGLEQAGKVVKIDVTLPNPIPVDVVTGLSANVQGVILEGNNLYIADGGLSAGSGRIIKVDITESFPPAIVEVVTGISPAGMVKVGDVIFYSGGFISNTVAKVDISQPNPTSEVIVSSGLSEPIGLTLNGQFIYVAQYSGDKISKIDLNAPAPSAVDVVTGLYHPGYCAFDGVDLYFPQEGSNMISKLEIAQPTMPALGTVCEGSTTTLGGASPTGGTYSGTGVTDDGNGQTFTFNATVAGLGATTVTYTAAGGSGLTATADVTVAPAVTASTSSTEDSGSGDGTATATPAGGTAPYTYSWNTTPEQTTATATGLAAGPYTVTITDANGCTATANVTVNNSVPADNACAGANDINSLFGGAVNTAMTSSLYDNTGYTSTGDPNTGFDCFAETPSVLDNTVWYSFTGDGETYRIRSVQCSATDYIDGGDTQVAVYEGSDCNSLTPVACNDDEDAGSAVYNIQLDLETTQGTVYYMLIDGYNGSDGEFCLEVTRQLGTGVAEADHQTVDIYPNPTEGLVSWSGITAQTAQVFDNTGRSVLTVAQPNGTVDISELTEGIYIMMLHTEEGVYTSRVVKQ